MYYGITGNFRALDNFYRQVTREWRKWLDRRSGKRSMPWERFNAFLARFLAAAQDSPRRLNAA